MAYSCKSSLVLTIAVVHVCNEGTDRSEHRIKSHPAAHAHKSARYGPKPSRPRPARTLPPPPCYTSRPHQLPRAKHRAKPELQPQVALPPFPQVRPSPTFQHATPPFPALSTRYPPPSRGAAPQAATRRGAGAHSQTAPHYTHRLDFADGVFKRGGAKTVEPLLNREGACRNAGIVCSTCCGTPPHGTKRGCVFCAGGETAGRGYTSSHPLPRHCAYIIQNAEYQIQTTLSVFGAACQPLNFYCALRRRRNGRRRRRSQTRQRSPRG